MALIELLELLGSYYFVLLYLRRYRSTSYIRSTLVSGESVWGGVLLLCWIHRQWELGRHLGDVHNFVSTKSKNEWERERLKRTFNRRVKNGWYFIVRTLNPVKLSLKNVQNKVSRKHLLIFLTLQYFPVSMVYFSKLWKIWGRDGRKSPKR